MSLHALIHSGLKSGKALVIKAFFASIPRSIPPITPKSLGVTLVGYHRADFGLSQALRYTAKAFEKVHFPFAVRELTPRLQGIDQSNRAMDPYLAPYCSYPINCLVINPDLLYKLPSWIAYSEWGRRYNIGYWFWELPNFPQEWRYAIPLIDEIWVNTEFNARAMAQAHPRVIKIPFGLEFDQPKPKFTRAYFDLPRSGFLFLVTFDFNSLVTRKNPAGAIEAFLAAFSHSQQDVFLIIKSMHGQLHTSAYKKLKLYARHDPRIIFIDQSMSTEEARGLLQCADCYVSLHRSEGLGLGMAESMYLGKPVIATAYSGNLEFMNDSNACLVDYTEIAVAPEEYPHAQNQVWAEPNLQTAALGMQKIFADDKYREALGANAQVYMLEHHSLAVMGEAMAKRLQEIERGFGQAKKLRPKPA